jgi:hypothetical protein
VTSADTRIDTLDFKGHRPLKSLILHPYTEGAWINSGFPKGKPFGGFSKGEALGHARQRLS